MAVNPHTEIGRAKSVPHYHLYYSRNHKYAMKNVAEGSDFFLIIIPFKESETKEDRLIVRGH